MSELKSSFCRSGFIENAWRKDLCSNCFRTKEEHYNKDNSNNSEDANNQNESKMYYQQPHISPWSHRNSTGSSGQSSPGSGSTSSTGSMGIGGTATIQIKTGTPASSYAPSISRYQSPSVGSGINTLGKYGHGQYRTGNNSSGINVTVNGTSNSNIKKYVQQHPQQKPPPGLMPHPRTNIPPPPVLTRFHGNHLASGGGGGGVSVSVGAGPPGRSLSYSNLSSTIPSTTLQLQQHHQPQSQNLLTHGSRSSSSNPTSNHNNSNPKSRVTNFISQTSSQQIQKPPGTLSSQITNNPNSYYNSNGTKNLSVTPRSSIIGMDSRKPPTIDYRKVGSGSGNSKKGILKVPNGSKRKLSVSFPQEVVEVIGYGGDLSSDDEYDDDPPYDPLDSSSVPDVLDKSCSSPSEKDLNRQTLKNTNFNSIKTNLLGTTCIEIGPIVGGTGGKSKPLVSIGTFESRKEPLRVFKKITADGEEIVSPNPTIETASKNLKEPIRTLKPVTKSPVKKISPPPILRKTEPIINKTVQPSISTPTSILSKVSNIFPKSVEISPSEPPKVPTNLIIRPKTFLRNEINTLQLSAPMTTLPIIEPPQPLDSLEPTNLYMNSRLAGDDFDDSLEADSGLDVKDDDKKTISNVQASDSDTEKSGSNSDSGNETDCIVDGRLNKGLFVAIDDGVVNNLAQAKTLEKLSPDSVISSEGVCEENNDSTPTPAEEVQDPRTPSPAPVPISAAPVIIPPILKRLAPPPPPIQSYEPDNEEQEEEALYDDVACFKPEVHETEEEESIYDDCATVKAQNQGSYDFMSSDNLEDDDDTDPVPLRQDEGVEFLGIRRIDSELFLNKQAMEQSRNPAPEKSSTLRSGSLSPKLSSNKTTRKVNQFFSTIGKKAGAAFRSANNSNNQGMLEFSGSSSSATPTPRIGPHRRSMSQDEVNIARTQELYGTLSPSNLKLRGLTPVLSKLSKLELSYNNNNNKEDEQSKDPSKKKKFSSSIKKFLKIGSKDHQLTDQLEPNELAGRHTVRSSVSPARPPPPPPRVHSLDVLENNTGPPKRSSHGTVKPARPPPPVVRRNQIEPSFMSVFTAPENPQYTQPPKLSPVEPFQPPNKPKRKSSVTNNREADGGAYTVNYLETTYNHITSLNFETLKLIASQTPVKIHGNRSYIETNNYHWSQFYVTDVEPLASGYGFVFYSSFWNDEEYVLLLQETLACGQIPLEFDCIEPVGSFEDTVQPSYIPWNPSDYAKTANGVRVFITILPSCTVQNIFAYIQNPSISPSRKFYAILQSLDYWGKEEVKDLIVFHQIPTSQVDPNIGPNQSKSSPSPNFGLVYVSPGRIRSSEFNHPPSRAEFEHHIKQLLLGGSLLCDNDKYILLRRLSNSTINETEAQFKLYLQLKLFGPQSSDLDKILRYRSEKQVTQWMDKERAFCMKDAIERTLQKQSEPISPLRKSFVEFLMLSDSCAKVILDFIVDLYPNTSL